MDATEALTQLGGVARAAQIYGLSSRGHLRGALRRGDILRLGHDRYALRHVHESVTAAQTARGYLSHVSAALHHGWPVRFPPAEPQVARVVSPAERAGWSTNVVRTLRDCLSDLAIGDALAVADSAVRCRSISYDDLQRAARTWPSHARCVARWADGRAENPFESSLRAVAIEAGLNVAAQWEVRASGMRLHPDVADPFLGLALEADSYAHHGATREDHESDCRRYNVMVLAGWRVLRFTWAEVMLDPTSVRRTLEAARDTAPGHSDGMSSSFVRQRGFVAARRLVS